MRFAKRQSEELKKFLYDSKIHDSKIKDLHYEWGTNTLLIKTFNPIFMVETDFTFVDVEIEFAIKGKELGSRETIISLTVESDYEPIIKCQREYSFNEESIYLLFQMFSGDEVHIVAKEVEIKVL